MNENKPIIYGIKTKDDKFHYIGKTKRNQKGENKLNKSDATRQYTNSSIRSIFQNDESTEVVRIRETDDAIWYNEKLLEVIKAYKENNPLLNAQWMLDGKRGLWEGTDGYWKGKKRDSNTLKRLSESKFKKVVQYDENGRLVKIWGSAKQVATEVFNDYRVINGSACSCLYTILRASLILSRLKHGSYWFREIELKEHFNLIPTKLNINVIAAREKQRKKASRKLANYIRPETSMKYSVEQYNRLKIIRTFENTDDAAQKLKIPKHAVQRICRGIIKHPKYQLRYGKKTQQPIKYKIPEIKVVLSIKKINNRNVRTKELCQIEALKYKTRSEFKKHDEACWRYSHRHGWFDEICFHMPKNVYKDN